MSKKRKNELKEQGVTPAIAKQFAAASKKNKVVSKVKVKIK